MVDASDTRSHVPRHPAPATGRELSRRRIGWVSLLIVLIVEVSLGLAFAQLQRASDSYIAANSISLAFVDVQRDFVALQSLALSAESLDDPEVVAAAALLERQIRIAETRLDNPSTEPELRADIHSVAGAFREYQEIAASTPDQVAAGATAAAAGNAVAKAATDRTETETRAAFLADARRARLAATLTAAAAGIIFAGGAVVSYLMLRRYGRAHDEDPHWKPDPDEQQPPGVLQHVQ